PHDRSRIFLDVLSMGKPRWRNLNRWQLVFAQPMKKTPSASQPNLAPCPLCRRTSGTSEPFSANGLVACKHAANPDRSIDEGEDGDGSVGKASQAETQAACLPGATETGAASNQRRPGPRRARRRAHGLPEGRTA